MYSYCPLVPWPTLALTNEERPMTRTLQNVHKRMGYEQRKCHPWHTVAEPNKMQTFSCSVRSPVRTKLSSHFDCSCNQECNEFCHFLSQPVNQLNALEFQFAMLPVSTENFPENMGLYVWTLVKTQKRTRTSGKKNLFTPEWTPGPTANCREKCVNTCNMMWIHSETFGRVHTGRQSKFARKSAIFLQMLFTCWLNVHISKQVPWIAAVLCGTRRSASCVNRNFSAKPISQRWEWNPLQIRSRSVNRAQKKIHGRETCFLSQ